MNYENVKKILIVRLSSIGDIVLTSEFVRICRSKFPDARIDYLIQAKFAELLKYNPHIDKLIKYNRQKSLKEIELLRDEYLDKSGLTEYDVIFDLQNNRRSKHWTNGISDVIYKIKKWRKEKIELVYLKKLNREVPKIPLNYLNVGSDFDLKSDEKGLEIWLENENSFDYTIKKQNNIIGIAPGAQHFSKRYPAEKFAKVVSKLEHRDNDLEFRIFGSVDDSKSAQKIIENNSYAKIKDYTGKLSLLETTREIDKCGRFISNDTGLMHLASSRKVPVIAIFGSTVKNFGFSPYCVPFKIAETNESLNCRPCSHIGKSSCPKKHFKCMESIHPDDIIKKLRELD